MPDRTMKAVVFDAPGKAEDVLRVIELAVPQPAQGEVLVRMDARPIQPSDLMFIGGRYRFKPVLPQVAGLEGSGTVAAAGTGTSLAAGTRVAFRYPGSWAEYACVPQSRLYIVPDGIQNEDAAQFSLNPITAWALLDEARVGTGEWIAVNAATSSVARLVIGLAQQRKVDVVAIVRATRTSVLPVPTVAADPAGLSERILTAAGGVPVVALLDSVGGPAITAVLPAIQRGGTIVSYGMLGAQPAQVSNTDMVYRNLCWKGFGIDRWLDHAGPRRARMVDELWQAIGTGAIALPVKARYSLEQAVEAIGFLSADAGPGKVLLCTPIAS